METQVRTPQLVFMQPQRLRVPLFQRPYVWNEENQWEPLWQDVKRVAERLLGDRSAAVSPHFLGAVVLQQVQNPVGSMQERIIIDGQQRLTTLQLLLDAFHAECQRIGATHPAIRLDALVTNPEAFWERPEDRFKVWPTNRDRAAFNEVMSAETPVEYSVLSHSSERLVQAHRFFSEQARQWLEEVEPVEAQERATALEKAVRELLQMVVIDLTADENAQEIFETLNARGAQLTAADLIKNFVFQRLMEAGADVEVVYEEQWKDFETGFWEAEVSSGRIRYPRSSIFLNQWLIAKTGEEIVAREIFARFKRYADFDAEIPIRTVVDHVHRSATQYRSIIEAAATKTGPLGPIELFVYRTSVLESETVKPFLLCLVDPDLRAVPIGQIHKALRVVESWMVRRMLVRATTKSYSQLFAELITEIQKGDREIAGDLVESYLRGQPGGARYWPDDDELRRELETLPVYRRLRRPRLRMVLEALEDHRRGWIGEQVGMTGERVARASYAIEHVMPREWAKNWPVDGGVSVEVERDRLVHTIGNLTLLNGRLNSKVSNGPWMGANSKRAGLEQHDVLLLNRDLLEVAGEDWTDEAIRQRSRDLTEAIIEIWPAPEGHRANHSGEPIRRRRRVGVADLIGAGMLSPGQSLYPRVRNPEGLLAIVLADGRIEVAGSVFETPSGAAAAVTGKGENGWWYFLVDPNPPRASLRKVWRQYVDQMTVDVEEDDDDSYDDTEEDIPDADR